MDDALKSAGWIVVIAFIAAYSTYFLASAAFGPRHSNSPPIVIRDKVRENEHHLTGTLHVRSNCELLSVSSKNLGSDVYELAFETWPDPAVECIRNETARSFDIVIFAPAVGTRFTATLDNNPLSVAVYPTLDTK